MGEARTGPSRFNRQAATAARTSAQQKARAHGAFRVKHRRLPPTCPEAAQEVHLRTRLRPPRVRSAREVGRGPTTPPWSTPPITARAVGDTRALRSVWAPQSATQQPIMPCPQFSRDIGLVKGSIHNLGAPSIRPSTISDEHIGKNIQVHQSTAAPPTSGRSKAIMARTVTSTTRLGALRSSEGMSWPTMRLGRHVLAHGEARKAGLALLLWSC